MKTLIRNIWLLLIILGTASAQTSIGRFLLLRPSALSNSMGGTGAAMDQSALISFSNAAALAFSPTASIAASFTRPLPFFDNVVHSYLTGSVRLDDVSAIGAAANVYWKGSHLGTTSSGILHSSENLMDWHLKLSYARVMSDDFAAGFSVGVLHLNLTEASVAQEQGTGKSTSVLFDGGILYRNLFPSSTFIKEEDDPDDPLASLRDQRAHNGVSAGLSFSNIGPKVTMIDAEQADPLPSTLIVGVAYSPIRTSIAGVMVTADAENQLYEGHGFRYLHWGAELQMFKFLAVRGGYMQNVSGPAGSYWTWGAGLRSYFLHLNIARYTRALLPSWQFDCTFSWGVR